MILTTYTCDRCGHAQEKSEQMWQIGVACIHASPSQFAYSGAPMHQQLWCRKCVEALGVIPPPVYEKKEPPLEPPTLEDMIRGIVENVIEENRHD